jgi:hypothetical protein
MHWLAYVSSHLFDTVEKRWHRVQGHAGLLRHSTFRSTLDVYTQAITPAKHAAQAAVLSLVFASEANGVSAPFHVSG